MALQARTTTTATTPAAAAGSGAAAPPAATDSYAAAYARLGAIAERLKGATGAGGGLDTMLADLQSARALHRQLKARLDAIRRELEADAAENETGGVK